MLSSEETPTSRIAALLLETEGLKSLSVTTALRTLLSESCDKVTAFVSRSQDTDLSDLSLVKKCLSAIVRICCSEVQELRSSLLRQTDIHLLLWDIATLCTLLVTKNTTDLNWNEHEVTLSVVRSQAVHAACSLCVGGDTGCEKRVVDNISPLLLPTAATAVVLHSFF